MQARRVCVWVFCAAVSMLAAPQSFAEDQAPASAPAPVPAATTHVAVPLPAQVAAPAPTLAPEPAPAPKMELFTALPQSEILNLPAKMTEKARQIKADPATASLQLVKINPKALEEKSLVMPLPGEGPVEFEYHPSDVPNTPDYTWWMGLTGQAGGGRATFTVRNGNVNGSIWTKKNVYRLSPLGDGIHSLVKVDSSKVPRH